jgi:hypothetical protein
LLQLQLLAAATAINLKRLLRHPDALAHGQAGDPARACAPSAGSPVCSNAA